MWKISNHICKLCMGRLLEKKEDNKRIVRCSDCGYEQQGHVKSLCCCGVKLKTGKDAGFRCIENPNKKPGFLSEIVCVNE